MKVTIDLDETVSEWVQSWAAKDGKTPEEVVSELLMERLRSWDLAWLGL